MKRSEQVQVVERPRFGLEAGEHIACIKCHEPIKAGELWREVERLGAGYVVAVHNACYIVQVPEQVTRIMAEVQTMLAPLTAEQREQVLPIFRAAVRIVDVRDRAPEQVLS